MDIFNKRILILSPHTDDAEFGCGGTIVKLLEQNNDIFIVAFSACYQSVLKDFPPDILITEVKAAANVLGVKKENLFLLDFDVRTFNYRRQEILDQILRFKELIQPNIVFLPSVNDVHQDHYTIAQEGLRAFKFCSLFSYEMPWNNLSFSSTCFSIINENHLEMKTRAIAEYHSQAHKAYANPNFVKSLAVVRGTQINQQYAECFEILRVIL